MHKTSWPWASAHEKPDNKVMSYLQQVCTPHLIPVNSSFSGCPCNYSQDADNQCRYLPSNGIDNWTLQVTASVPSSTTQRTSMNCKVAVQNHPLPNSQSLPCFRPGLQVEMKQLHGSVFRLPDPSQVRRPDSVCVWFSWPFHGHIYKMWYQRSQIMVNIDVICSTLHTWSPLASLM